MEKRKIYEALLAYKGSCGGIGLTCHQCPVRHICHDSSTSTSAPVRIYEHVKEWLAMDNATNNSGIQSGEAANAMRARLDELRERGYGKPPLGPVPDRFKQHKCTCDMSDIMNFGCKCGGY